MKMEARLHAKPWGQLNVSHLPGGSNSSARIGEVSFQHPEDVSLPVLIKYLYTSERLSIQVHPNNQEARARGQASGKDEMWIVLDAQPGSTIGIGLTSEITAEELRRAVTDGSIVDLVDWRPVSPGDVIYNPAGTVHAAGAGLVLLEVQQAADITYRLHDYGRPRELHLHDGLAVAKGRPHSDSRDCSLADGDSRLLVTGPYFGAAWCAGSLPEGIPAVADHYQLVVVEGEAVAGGISVKADECWLAGSLDELCLGQGTIALLAWPATEALALAA